MDTPMNDTPSAIPAAEVPTPPASSVAPSHHPSPLPQPRKKPLRPGGPKEGELISYLDHTLTGVRGRWSRRMFEDSELRQGVTKGYKSFREAAADIDGLIDVVWVSGSPNLQIPYLLTIASLVADFLPTFPPSPQATFRILDKLDHAFSSLLQGKDSDTAEPLPGFENGRTVSTTDKVRLKSIVEGIRVIVVKALSGERQGEEDPADTEDESMAEASEAEGRKEDTVKFEGFDEFDDTDDDEEDEDEREEMHVAKVFERTLVELSDVLGGPPIGIITED